MRRAFQRCSASLPRSLSTLPNTTSIAQQCLRRRPHAAQSIVPTITYPATRAFVQTTRRQDAARGETSAPITRFDELAQKGLVHHNVIDAITRGMNIETMTEVQQRTINEALKGQDVIAQAKTGTGKTLAFLLPVVQRILQNNPELAQRGGGRPRANDTRGLIISPTRELAEQIGEEARKLLKNTGLVVQTAVGGTGKAYGLRQIERQGCHLLIGTPGRLKDILSDSYNRVEAPKLQAFVLDEADRLLDQGFWPEIQEIQRLLPTTAEVDRQTLMFSATVPKEVVSLVRSTLKPGFNFVKCVNDNEAPTHERVPQNVVRLVGLENCVPALAELCQRGLEEGQKPGGRPFKAIAFFNSTAEVSLANRILSGLQSPDGRRHPWYPTQIREIHSKLTQDQRTRAADSFRRSDTGILLGTDVVARGMDFPNVTHVIQVGLPVSREQYIHRIGRTGRAGKEGEAWLLINEIESREAGHRLRGIPLKEDTTLQIPKMDMTQAADVPAHAGRILSMYQRSVKEVSIPDKAKVYLAQLGVYQWYQNKQKLVDMMNNLSRFGWGMATPPRVSPMLATKLKLRGVEGLTLGSDDFGEEGRGAFGGQDRFGGNGDRFGRDNRRSGFDGRPEKFGGGGDRFGGPRDGSSAPRGSYGGGSRDGGFNRGGRDGGFNRGGRDGGFNRGGRDGGFNRGGRDGGYSRGNDNFGRGKPQDNLDY